MVLHTVKDCHRHIGKSTKRRRCRHCVKRGGRFHMPGLGRCEMAPPPPAGVIHSIPECNHRLPHHRRHRCRKCIKRGGSYHVGGGCQL
jgi:hypothetical protein